MFDSSSIVMIIGFIIFIDCILIAFIGYVLPLTQMSYWGLTVFSNILSTIPIWGEFLVYWLWGSEFISEGTLVKMHTLHIVLPFILLMIMVVHLFFLHYFLSSDVLDRFVFYIERCFFVYWYYFRDLLLLLVLVWVWFYLIFIYWYFVFHEESWVIVEVLKTSEKVNLDIDFKGESNFQNLGESWRRGFKIIREGWKRVGTERPGVEQRVVNRESFREFCSVV